MDQSPSAESVGLTAEQLLAELYAHAKADRQKDIVAAVEREWDAMTQRAACIEDAESCRIMMLALFKLGRYYDAWIWRARVMLRATEVGWLDGVAALLQTEALRIQAVENGSTKVGDPEYVVVPQAVAMLEELRPYIGDVGPNGHVQPSPRFHGRSYYEKTAFLACAAGNYDEALARYSQAKAYIQDDERGELKVEGGWLNTWYQSSSASEPRAEALRRTTELAARCRQLGHEELARLADLNAERMTAGERVTPYETL